MESNTNKVEDPGVGRFSKEKAKRFISEEGTFNVIHKNRKRIVNETYTYLIGLSWSHFLLLLTLSFIVLNSLFAAMYLVVGVENIGIKPVAVTVNFYKAFFFSVQTITSVGYGLYAPTKLLAGIISSIEAFVGLISFAFVTGLLYGRFSKPKSNIRFSKNILYTDYRQGKALMFRVVNRRKSMVVLPKIKVSMSISKPDGNNGFQNEFFNLKLERKQITYLPTSWTLVHEIDADSPLKNYTVNQLLELHAEILILLSYHDDSFNDVLHQAHSYTFNALKINYKFKKAFDFNSEGKVVLDHAKIDDIELI